MIHLSPHHWRRLAAALIIACIGLLAAHAGQWQAYNYTNTYRRACCLGDRLYVLKDNALFVADADSWQIDHELSRQDGLSGTSILDLLFVADARKAAVIYTDGAIDVIHADGSISALPDLRLAPMPGIRKAFLSARSQEGLIFIHTSYGFAVADMSQEAIVHNFQLGNPATCAWAYDGVWYYTDDTGTYYCPQRGSNPYVKASWRRSTTTRISQSIVLHAPNGQEQCWMRGADKQIYRLIPGFRMPSRCQGGPSQGLMEAGQYIMSLEGSNLALYDTSLGHAATATSQAPAGQRRLCSVSSPYGSAIDVTPAPSSAATFTVLTPSAGVTTDTLIITSDTQFSLRPLTAQGITIADHQQSPNFNRVAVDAIGNLALTQILPISMMFNVVFNTQGILSTLTPKTGVWDNVATATIASKVVKGRFRGITSMVPDPNFSLRFWFTTLEDGIICVDHGRCYTQYTNANSSLTTGSGALRVGSVAFDGSGNMWCVNEMVRNCLVARRRSDGKWFSFAVPGIESALGFSNLMVTQHTPRRQVWGSQSMSYERTYIFCYEYGTDIADKADDRSTTFYQLIPQGDGAAPFTPHYNRGLAESPSGAVWILNTSGIYVIDNPADVFDHPGEVRTVMNNVVPTAITFDAAGRAWIGTELNGIYLLSPDGNDILAQFDTSTSPIAGNEVTSLAYDRRTNTLWACAGGQIISYSYDTAEFDAQPTLPPTSALLYPSRVASGEAATVLVSGLQVDAEVTVMGADAAPAFSSVAVGGIISIPTQALTPGTYTVLSTDSDGHQGALLTFGVTP